MTRLCSLILFCSVWNYHTYFFFFWSTRDKKKYKSVSCLLNFCILFFFVAVLIKSDLWAFSLHLIFVSWAMRLVWCVWHFHLKLCWWIQFIIFFLSWSLHQTRWTQIQVSAKSHCCHHHQPQLRWDTRASWWQKVEMMKVCENACVQRDCVKKYMSIKMQNTFLKNDDKYLSNKAQDNRTQVDTVTLVPQFT